MEIDFSKSFDEDTFYKKIGEYVVLFQWVENLIRQIGWFCIDPDMMNHPSLELRNDSNNELLNKVELLHGDFILKYRLQDKRGFKIDFVQTIKSLHVHRKFRNKLLHSAYHEIKSCGEIVAMVQTNAKIKTDVGLNEPISDFSLISFENIDHAMRTFSVDAFNLGMYFTQLKHWYWAILKEDLQRL